ncbi:MAG TPA: high-affinity nickel-transport family protein [Candidatus Limnocylindria bacterium]|nr:high-affinity nickel-transport family protein [Candidatus Limnocylindria bacterium]
MISLLSIIALGFFLGMRHATDPDHVVAVTTIVSGQRNLTRAALTGVFWGIGHTLTILVVGAGIILFKLVISPWLGLGMELSVGLMLVALGLMNLFSFFRAMPEPEAKSTREPSHDHSGRIHAHFPGDPHEGRSGHATPMPLATLDRALGKIVLYQNIRPLIVGVIHGLAGSAAVALLVLTTISSSRWALAYLLVFGVGTIAGMMLITMSVASAFRYVGARSEVFGRRLGLAAGLVSLAFGLFLAYQIGFANGLFAGHPRWIPR